MRRIYYFAGSWQEGIAGRRIVLTEKFNRKSKGVWLIKRSGALFMHIPHMGNKIGMRNVFEKNTKISGHFAKPHQCTLATGKKTGVWKKGRHQ